MNLSEMLIVMDKLVIIFHKVILKPSKISFINLDNQKQLLGIKLLMTLVIFSQDLEEQSKKKESESSNL